MAEDMKGKVALVTGGGSGIGRGAAFAFARKGAAVAVADVVGEAAEETVRRIRGDGGKALSIRCDVSKSSEVKAMVDKTVETLGRLDYAFNNAGIIGSITPIVDYGEEEWDRVLAIDLKGVWLCMKYEIPIMLNQGGGVIVNTGSVSGLIGSPGFSAYTAAKHGVVGLTKTVALEYAKSGIRVNAVCPGGIRTEMLEQIIKMVPESEQAYKDAHPIGRMGRAEEVAEAVIWLCSDAASFMTGSSLVIDGGYTAQ
jgi:NAD(P)-dependent dehydrogenase (short-subunit alcohol dehydrogenase family)